MFQLSTEQRDIKQAAREFAEKEFVDVARDMDENERFDDAIWKKTAENGFLGVFIPEEYGGAGLGHFEQCLIIEEFARIDGGIAQSMVASYFGTQMIKLFGTVSRSRRTSPCLQRDLAGGHGIHGARCGKRCGGNHHDRRQRR